MSFNCTDDLLGTIGGLKDGCQLVIWNMKEGKSEVFQPASVKANEECTDIVFFNKEPHRFVTSHNHTIKIWTYDYKVKRLSFFDCPLG